MDRDVVLQAHFYILNNLSVVEPYIVAHEKVIKKKYPRMNDKLLLTRLNKEFISWSNMRISNDDCASETIKWLSYMPKFTMTTWMIYNISNYYFSAKEKDVHTIIQNNWVMVEAESMYFSSSKDKNQILATSAFYGFIEDIWRLVMLLSTCIYLNASGFRITIVYKLMS